MLEGVQNYMEVLVEAEVEGIIKSVGGCMCDKCKRDICAIALNHLRPMYVVTEKGAVLTKVATSDVQNRADVLAAVTYGASVVSKNMKHDEH